jgi:hypothetical protein
METFLDNGVHRLTLYLLMPHMHPTTNPLHLSLADSLIHEGKGPSDNLHIFLRGLAFACRSLRFSCVTAVTYLTVVVWYMHHREINTFWFPRNLCNHKDRLALTRDTIVS